MDALVVIGTFSSSPDCSSPRPWPSTATALERATGPGSTGRSPLAAAPHPGQAEAWLHHPESVAYASAAGSTAGVAERIAASWVPPTAAWSAVPSGLRRPV